MPPRKQPRRIARELALLSLSQVKGSQEQLEQLEIDDLLLAATRTLTSEVNDALETAAAELRRSEEQLLHSDTRATTVIAAKNMVEEAIKLAQTAINRVGSSLEIPEMVQLATRHEVRTYAIEMISTVCRRRQEIEQQLEGVMVDWQLSRLPKIDRDILALAAAEMLFLEIPHKVAINEAVELAKVYSDEDGYRFINGVLRRFTDRLSMNSKEIK